MTVWRKVLQIDITHSVPFINVDFSYFFVPFISFFFIKKVLFCSFTNIPLICLVIANSSHLILELYNFSYYLFFAFLNYPNTFMHTFLTYSWKHGQKHNFPFYLCYLASLELQFQSRWC